ncbi:MAG: hypothetical protein GX575_25565 [Candidatus Anammoximicrobium sp.]|nr:hypothetical protein [Candidatus Anammoximicrobium sp.]
MDIIITATGDGRCIYAEDIDLTALGKLTIRRGSHVESTPDARWTADMSPVGGPVLGPFRRWSEAIAAEHEWLAEHWLQPGSRS